MTETDYDILIRGGRVIDPSQGIDEHRDVAVKGDRVVAVEPSLKGAAAKTVEAAGLLVTPGLIDLHVHGYTHAPLGLDVDTLCAPGGVTTMLDAGTAGSYNFDAFRRDNIDRAQTQLLALVNLSCIGLIAAHLGELMDPRYADPAGVVAAIDRHRDVAVGVKIRAGAHLIGEGEQGWANLRAALTAARESDTWLMVHIGDCPMSIPELCDVLQPGDCITHCFKGGKTRVTDDQGRVHPAVKEAADRGVVFDVGHGFGSFQWEVVQASLDQGLEPTTISTDLHIKNLHGPVYDMPTTMSKFLHLGVPLARVIEMSTTAPAKVLGRESQLGTLKEGTIADITLLETRQGRFTLTDSYGSHRQAEELLSAAGVIRRGKMVPGGGGWRNQHEARGE